MIYGSFQMQQVREVKKTASWTVVHAFTLMQKLRQHLDHKPPVETNESAGLVMGLRD